MTIKAPFNFVPLNKKVVYPYWADSVSHDVPFSDGQSGCLELEIEAISPIFVRNGQKQGSAKQESQPQPSAADAKTQTGASAQQDFSNDQDKYFLPGTSIKGAVRSVLEIMSFSKLADKVNDHQYSFRDLRDDKDYLPSFKPEKVMGGWLKYDEEKEEYHITSAGRPGRIKHEEIDRMFGQFISNEFTIQNISSSQKTAKYKYDQILSGNTRYEVAVKKTISAHGLDYYEFSEEPNITGYLIFTGQPGPSGIFKKGGKRSEFIFFKGEENTTSLPVSPLVIRNFKFAYFDHDRNKTSVDWEFWRKKLYNGEEIPVFFSKQDGKVVHMGLSYLYKLPFNNSVRASIYKHQKPDIQKLDLSQVIFGHVTPQKLPLKGRVSFGHAYAEQVELLEVRTEVLGSPKASYYPIYIWQPNKGQYNTFMHEEAEISGWKRYPVRKGNNTTNNPPPTINGKTNLNVATRFKPVKEGAVFRCRVQYHNLRMIELGALLSALTFHGTPDTFHSIGMAKPLGLGKVKIRVNGIETSLKQACLGAYECYMENELRNNGGWLRSEQLAQLLAMSIEQENDEMLAYMALKDHASVKTKDHTKQSLPRYTKIGNRRTAQITSFLNHTFYTDQLLQQEKERFATVKPSAGELFKQINDAEEIRFQAELKYYIEQLMSTVKEAEVQLLTTREQLDELKQKSINKQNRELESIKAKQNGPEWKELTKGSKSFENLSKDADTFIRTYHQRKTPDAQPQFPIEFSDQLVKKITEVFISLNKREKNKWVEKNSAQFKKFEQWLGKEKATEIIESLKRSLDGKE